MKIRNGFVSNSSSSSFVIALPKEYKFSEEELKTIRDYIEEYDDYFSYYEEKAEEAGETELLDEREKIQMMLDGKAIPEDVEPVTDEIKNADIQKGLKLLTTSKAVWMEEPDYNVEVTEFYTAMAIYQVLRDKILIGTISVGADSGSQILNILSTSYEDKEALKLARESLSKE